MHNERIGLAKSGWIRWRALESLSSVQLASSFFLMKTSDFVGNNIDNHNNNHNNHNDNDH